MTLFDSRSALTASSGRNLCTGETPPARPHLFGLLAGLFLAAGLVVAALAVAGAWTRIAASHVSPTPSSAHKMGSRTARSGAARSPSQPPRYP